MKNFKKYFFATFVYYLYNYILIISLAASVKFFRQTGDPDYILEDSIFSFQGNYFFMVVSYFIALLISSALAYWIIDKPSKKAMFWISLPYAICSLVYGILAMYVIYWTEFKQFKDEFNDGYIFLAFGFLIPIISNIWAIYKIDIACRFFQFKKRNLLWIWIPLLLYLPAIFVFVIFGFFQRIHDFFTILPSLQILESIKQIVILFLLSILFKFYYKPLVFALDILNRDLMTNLGSLKRGGVIFAILTGGFMLAFGIHYLISLVPF